MSAWFRETPAGKAIRLLSGKQFLKYPEEQPGFELPAEWKQVCEEKPSSGSISSSSEQLQHDAQLYRPSATSEASDEESQRGKDNGGTNGDSPSVADEEGAMPEVTKTKSIPLAPRKTRDGHILVDWYRSDDDENPYNWSRGTRIMVASVIGLYTFIVYLSSAIYTPSVEGVMEAFGVNLSQSNLGLALFVLGYGIGPLIFSPLSELPSIGRNPIYIVTMFLFVIVSIPTALAASFEGLMVARFFQGFFGSPCLASGAATMGDMFGMTTLPYALVLWVSSAYCGPALGPLLSGFSVPAMGWRWSLLEIIWGSAPVFIAMLFLLPETSTPALLYNRAARLRKVTGDARFLSQSELDRRGLTSKEVFVDAIIKPLEITIKDPAILFVQIYTAIVYGIYYSFFEVFPLVFPVYYGMSYGEVGLVFLCVLVACLIGATSYVAYIYFYMNPLVARLAAPPHNTAPKNEIRLVPALFASFGPTIGLFIFAWTASPAFPWIAPTIGITLYGAAAFVVMQCIFVYVPMSYPQYAASLFAANDFFRSASAFASILYAGPLFGNLGVARGVTLLAGLSVIGIVGIWLLYYTGERLRKRSSFAVYKAE
ncbi:benomyl/methotrexate resistance protein [Microdochium bolleyi]|uniref:Benomyl/methotrexate resistance protein n=1 Tax=Microdochium bolleyi TaxID=196109 RepID=A0A136JDX2_9PEZI|nr:benomyl/methotrexate resistance protein [Microdochium bolleyi]